MYTTNIELLETIVETLVYQKNEIKISQDLELAITEKTGLFNCTFYDQKLGSFSLIFEGEINITKCLNNEIDIDEQTNTYGLKDEYFEGKKNHLGQECLKVYGLDFEYENKNYQLEIIEYFGQIRNDKKGRYDGFKSVLIQIPNELICLS
jgi:hypothetical protein